MRRAIGLCSALGVYALMHGCADIPRERFAKREYVAEEKKLRVKEEKKILEESTLEVMLKIKKNECLPLVENFIAEDALAFSHLSYKTERGEITHIDGEVGSGLFSGKEIYFLFIWNIGKEERHKSSIRLSASVDIRNKENGEMMVRVYSFKDIEPAYFRVAQIIELEVESNKRALLELMMVSSLGDKEKRELASYVLAGENKDL